MAEEGQIVEDAQVVAETDSKKQKRIHRTYAWKSQRATTRWSKLPRYSSVRFKKDITDDGTKSKRTISNDRRSKYFKLGKGTVGLFISAHRSKQNFKEAMTRMGPVFMDLFHLKELPPRPRIASSFIDPIRAVTQAKSQTDFDKGTKLCRNRTTGSVHPTKFRLKDYKLASSGL